ncbi:MAG: hypothetical protein IJP23_02895 [Oscillospiraceae bacterium]|nr:hypothetical protein [Oscillospiraceae bacterium]
MPGAFALKKQLREELFLICDFQFKYLSAGEKCTLEIRHPGYQPLVKNLVLDESLNLGQIWLSKNI